MDVGSEGSIGEKKKSKVLKDVTNTLLGKAGISKANWAVKKSTLESLKKLGNEVWAEKMPGPSELPSRQSNTEVNGPPQPTTLPQNQNRVWGIGAVPPKLPDPNPVLPNLGQPPQEIDSFLVSSIEVEVRIEAHMDMDDSNSGDGWS